MIEKINIKLSEDKILNFTLTKVYQDIRNYFLFALDMNDYYDLNNIIVLSEFVIKILDNYLKSININLFRKNLNFNNEFCKELYQENKFNIIIKKIDKIIEYIKLK